VEANRRRQEETNTFEADRAIKHSINVGCQRKFKVSNGRSIDEEADY
jgi:hypothetical protein